jgi:phosphoribosylglycinamide formyltransferase-1
MLNIAVFGSGRGSNFRAILQALEAGTLPGARIACVISNNSAAGILDTARAHGIPALHLSAQSFPSDDAYVTSLLALLKSHGANLIVLAGYMKLLAPRLIEEFRGRILNIHPALLPRFGGKGMYGIHVHEAVLAAGENESGATVHLVDEVYDHGAVILQKRVPVLPGDTPDTLAARVLTAEHELLPEVLRRIARGEIAVPGLDAVPSHTGGSA